MTQSNAAIQARREYQRRWRKANPDKVREQNRRYWEKKAHEAARRGAESITH
ncbi:MAG: phosphatase [Clostridia bacterium]|nr:phosphatase [Clostridia bacterium]